MGSFDRLANTSRVAYITGDEKAGRAALDTGTHERDTASPTSPDIPGNLSHSCSRLPSRVAMKRTLHEIIAFRKLLLESYHTKLTKNCL